jgi:hypothetical protein
MLHKVCPSMGETTGIVCPDAAAAHCPSINKP